MTISHLNTLFITTYLSYLPLRFLFALKRFSNFLICPYNGRLLPRGEKKEVSSSLKMEFFLLPTVPHPLVPPI